MIYVYVLERLYEEEGAKFWSDELYNFRRNREEAAQGFIFSQEFYERDKIDFEFVEILYRTFFDREPDESGMSYWLVSDDPRILKVEVNKLIHVKPVSTKLSVSVIWNGIIQTLSRKSLIVTAGSGITPSLSTRPSANPTTSPSNPINKPTTGPTSRLSNPTTSPLNCRI